MKLILSFAIFCVFVASASKSEKPEVPESQRKRDAGYSYSRPSRIVVSHRLEPIIIRNRVPSRSSASARPFAQYGPPRRPGSSKSPESSTETGSPQRVPSPIRESEFAEPSPIAGQNNVPFDSNSANYLPPKNQKLPGYGSSGFQASGTRPQGFRINVQPEKLVRGEQNQISDAAYFLTQNSQAISQLYETPAINVNYEPLPENQESGVNLRAFETTTLASLGTRIPEFSANFPSYASGILDRDALRSIKSLEKDRLIEQLRSDLASSRYALNQENLDMRKLQFLGTQGSLSSSSQIGNKPYGVISSSPGYTYAPPTTTSKPISTVATVTPVSQGPDIAQRPQTPLIPSSSNSQATNSIPSAASIPFPQLGGFVPLLGTSFLNYPYGTNLPGSSSVQTTSPTHLALPIPTSPIHETQKPETSNQIPLGSNFKPSTAVPIAQVPIQPIHPVAPLQPTFPLVPAINQIPTLSHIQTVNQVPVINQIPAINQIPLQTSLQTSPIAHPTYGVQNPVNPLLIKPSKPLYPLYFYPNVYQLQKPALTTLPWNYAPAFQAAKTEAWK